MPSIEEVASKEEPKDTVHVSDSNRKDAEAVGYEKKPTSTALTESLKDSKKLKEIREHKKEELREELLEIKKICDIYGIKFAKLL